MAYYQSEWKICGWLTIIRSSNIRLLVDVRGSSRSVGGGSEAI